MKNLLKLENIVMAPIKEGDAGVILREDGTFQIFSSGKIDPENLSQGQVEQGRKLNALALALSLPQVMEVLLRMADDPAIVGEPGVDLGLAH
jgi:hypothetical protein